MKKNYFGKVVVWIISICILSACHSAHNKFSGTYFKWKDSYGREVCLEKEPQRIVSLSPGITEVLFLIHAQDKLVGVSDFCVYPSETEHLKKVGGMQNINMEALLSLHPDVVLIGSIVSKKDVETIEKMHIPIIAIREENSLEGMPDEMEVLGRITNHLKEASEQSKLWKRKIAKFNQLNTQRTTRRNSVYYVVGFGDSGDFTAPKNTYINEIINLAGGKNAGASLTDWNVSREFLFKFNPDIILVRKEDFETFTTRYPYTLLTAVKNKKVYPIDSGWIDVVSPRNLMAVEYLQKIISIYDIQNPGPKESKSEE